MPKFRTVHKFGRKKKRISRRKEPLPSADLIADSTGGTEETGGNNEGDGGERVPESDRIRVDTVILSAAEQSARQQEAEEKLTMLSTMSATERKVAMFADYDTSEATPSPNTTFFTIVDLDAVNSLLHFVKCISCGGGVRLERGERDYGVAVKLELHCSNCGIVQSEWSSPRVKGHATCNPFEINILAARAMQSTGNGQTALNDIFAVMRISHRGLHHKTYQDYMKKKLNPAASAAVVQVMSQCGIAVAELYKGLCFGNSGNVAVSYDGSWKTRGHSSHICVGTVIELFTGCVLDFVVLSNFCLGCQLGPKESDPGYLQWKSGHACQKNSDSKAGRMEVEAALILFQRSLARHNLRYTTMLCDGDSRSFLALQEARVYGYIAIEKEDCTNHVQKRMGTALRNLVKTQRAGGQQSLGGKGKLTSDLIAKLTSYYGWSLRSHSGDVEAMHKAVMATYHHICSTDSQPKHELCPQGEQSWCKQAVAKATGQPMPKHRYNLPEHVCKALLPVYEHLADRKLLQRCQRGKTQNSNESLHSVIWSLAAKTRHASLFAVEAAVAEAVMRFNAGKENASAQILRELQVNNNAKSSKRAAEKDHFRSVKSSRRSTSLQNFSNAMKRRQVAGKDEDYVPGGF